MLNTNVIIGRSYFRSILVGQSKVGHSQGSILGHFISGGCSGQARKHFGVLDGLGRPPERLLRRGSLKLSCRSELLLLLLLLLIELRCKLLLLGSRLRLNQLCPCSWGSGEPCAKKGFFYKILLWLTKLLRHKYWHSSISKSSSLAFTILFWQVLNFYESFCPVQILFRALHLKLI